jgi:cellulose synthase operon protein C
VLWTAVDALLVATLVAIVAFPLAARISASDAGIHPPKVADPGTVHSGRGQPLRDVPRFTGDPPAEKALVDVHAMGAALDAEFRSLLGDAGPGLYLTVRNPQVSVVPNISDTAKFAYPFRYPRIDPLLDRTLGTSLSGARADDANDLADLLMLASARFPYVFPNAGPVAFSLLNRARAGGSCAAQLDLAFLVATDSSGRDDVTATEFGRAEKTCPGDPAPLYLLGQFQSQRTVTIDFVGDRTPRAERIRRTFATFRELQRRFPASPAGWAGEGDAWLRLAYDVRGFAPFTARNRFEKALALYRHGEQVSSDPTIAAGEARAQEGLAHADDAVAAQKRALKADPASARLQAALTAYLEEAHRFVEAADVNGRFLSRSSHLFAGPGLFTGNGALTDGIYANDADDPLSLGVDRLQPLVSVLSPPPELGAGVEDVSFIPLYHDVYGLTGVDKWCRGWSWRRDLVLAGDPKRALVKLPAHFNDPKYKSGCGDSGALRQAALAESGDFQQALDDVRARSTSYEDTPYQREPDPDLALLQDNRENLWRFAGNRNKALAVIRDWRGGFLPADREGEIDYLHGDFAAAADLFAEAAQRAKRPIDRALELLKAGTALEHDGKFDGARSALRQADAQASKIAASQDYDNRPQAIYSSYNARVQLGDTELRARHFKAAVPYYEAAHRREKGVDNIGSDRPLVRPEVLDNNQALVLAFLGREKEALVSIDRALGHDRENPIFLENRGFVLYRMGKLDEAEQAYEASLASDPTVFPSANDLGVILVDRGRLAEAETALRKAIGAQPRYATGWFNLGIVLQRRGAGHLLESQGAFGKAFSLDSGLRSHQRKLIFDADPFFTTLDLSKPLPPDWSYAKSTSRAPVAVAAFVIFLLLLRAGRALATELLSGKAQERALEQGHRGLERFARLGQGVTPLVAIGVTVGVVLWPLLAAGGAPWEEDVAIGVGTLALVGLYLRVRARAAAHRGVTVRHFTWAPSVPLSIGAAALGFGYAPLPPAEHGEEHRFVRAAAVLALGGAAVALLLLGKFTEVPVTRALGATALVMTSSVLTPVKPLDGAFFPEGRAGLAVSLGVLALAVLLAVGIL